MGEKTQIVITTAGSNVPLSLPAAYSALTPLTSWQTLVAQASRGNYPSYTSYSELHYWSVAFEKISEIESIDIMSELIEDALKAAEWEIRTEQSQYIDFYNTLTGATGMRMSEGRRVYIRDGLKIVVTDNAILFAGKGSHFIDETADIVTNEDLLLSFLDWLYEGGDCPIIKPLIKRIHQKIKTPTYPTSNDHLARKNNRKK